VAILDQELEYPVLVGPLLLDLVLIFSREMAMATLWLLVEVVLDLF